MLHERHARALGHIEAEGEVVLVTRLDSNGQQFQVEKESLWLRIAAAAEKQMLSILVQLGLTPKARDAVRPTKAAEEEATGEPTYDEWVRRQGIRIIARSPII